MSVSGEPILVKRSVWKGAVTLVLFGFAVWALIAFSGVDSDGGSRWKAASMFGLAALVALGAILIARDLIQNRQLEIGPRGLVFHRRWDGQLVVPWTNQMQVRAFEFRGSQSLTVYEPISGRKARIVLYELTPFEIARMINAYRRSLGHSLPTEVVADILQAGENAQRNRARRLGMAALGAGAIVGFLSLHGVRQVGVRNLPPGVDFLWADPPSLWNIALALPALGLSAYGLWLWLWPRRGRANPPILSTFTEQLLLGTAGIAVFGPIYLIITSLLHPFW